MLSLPPTIRAAERREWRELGDLVGTAFAADPVTSWTLGHTDLIRATFRILARDLYLRRGCGWFAGSMGGAMWLDPGMPRTLPFASTLVLAGRILTRAGPGAILRAMRVDAAFGARRPPRPHAYLFAVGLLPDARGQGLGRRLLSPHLHRLDAAGLPAWLENTHPGNDAFYRSLGFVAQETFHPAPGAPPVTTMLRLPRTAYVEPNQVCAARTHATRAAPGRTSG